MTDKAVEVDFGMTVSDLITDRSGRPRWAVTALFVDLHGSEPRCIDYRVRVLPVAASNNEAVWIGDKVVKLLEADMSGQRPEYFLAAELSPPTEGIPRHVFERASQARLLAKARALAERRPDLVNEQAQQLLARQERPRVGRPPTRTIGERLNVLADVGQGMTLEQVGKRHHMSRSAVRDLVAWARHDAVPPLFTAYGPGRRGGELTAAARRLIETEDGES